MSYEWNNYIVPSAITINYHECQLPPNSLAPIPGPAGNPFPALMQDTNLPSYKQTRRIMSNNKFSPHYLFPPQRPEDADMKPSKASSRVYIAIATRIPNLRLLTPLPSDVKNNSVAQIPSHVYNVDNHNGYTQRFRVGKMRENHR